MDTKQVITCVQKILYELLNFIKYLGYTKLFLH